MSVPKNYSSQTFEAPLAEREQDQDLEEEAELEDKLLRSEICKLRGLKGYSPVSTPEMNKIKLKRAMSCGEDEEIVARLHLALWPRNDMDDFHETLKNNPDLIESKFGKCKDTLLMRAARYGKADAVRDLVKMTAKIDATNINGQTALHLASIKGKEDVLETLLNAGADVFAKNLHNCSPAHLAAKAGSLRCLELILEKAAASGCHLLNCKGRHGNTFLHYAVQFGRLEMTQFLIAKGLDVNARNDLSETPLHLAASGYFIGNGSVIVELLLNAGAELNATTAWGDTAAHYAALSGTLDNLQYLVEAGIPLTKSQNLNAEAWRMCQKFQLSKDVEEAWRYNLLQKVAKSSCINKSVYLLDKMMQVRNKCGAQASKPIFGSHGREEAFLHEELCQQDTELLMLCKEFHRDMAAPDSALKLFLKHTPDALEHLFDRCISSYCESEQVQGKIFFDFFLFSPPPRSSIDPKEDGKTREKQCLDTGELTLPQILVSHNKQHYLLHPLFETFIKLKWLKTQRLYVIFVVMWALYVISVAGFGLTQFGQFKDSPSRDFWWYFLLTMIIFQDTSWLCSLTVLVNIIKNFKKQVKSANNRTKYFTFSDVVLSVLDHILMATVLLFPYLSLFTNLSLKTKSFITAINIIASCFHLVRLVSRFPGFGLYMFMMKQVTLSIAKFFVAYFWHFFGYAIAFHLIMPQTGAFSSVDNSIIKVLTMLLGEYDFTDNFVGEHTFWLSKVIFVIFVVDMSVVLMNLVIGLAVSDVEAIKRQSNVQRLMHETFTVIYLEQVYRGFSRFPCIGSQFDIVRLLDYSKCSNTEFFYLNLVDIADNTENSLNIFKAATCSGAIIHESHPVPKSITQSIVDIQRKRLTTGNVNKPDPICEEIIDELKVQNFEMRRRVDEMDEKMNQLLNMVTELRAKLL